MSTELFHTRRPHRSFTANECEAFLLGSRDPHLSPLQGKETEVRRFLDEEVRNNAIEDAKHKVESWSKQIDEDQREIERLEDDVRSAEECLELSQKRHEEAKKHLADIQGRDFPGFAQKKSFPVGIVLNDLPGYSR